MLLIPNRLISISVGSFPVGLSNRSNGC